MAYNNVKRMVVITEAMFSKLMNQRADISSKEITTLTEPNSDFNNLKRVNQDIDTIRFQREANANSNANNNDTIPNYSIANTTSNTLNTSLQPETGDWDRGGRDDDENRMFLEKIRNLSPQKIQNRMLALTNRILNEPQVRVNRGNLEYGTFSFPVLNFYDFFEAALSQRKPHYIQDLDRFVSFYRTLKLPISYISNRYIREQLVTQKTESQDIETEDLASESPFHPFSPSQFHIRADSSDPSVDFPVAELQSTPSNANQASGTPANLTENQSFKSLNQSFSSPKANEGESSQPKRTPVKTFLERTIPRLSWFQDIDDVPETKKDDKDDKDDNDDNDGKEGVKTRSKSRKK